MQSTEDHPNRMDEDPGELAKATLRYAAPKTAALAEELGVDPIVALGAALEASCKMLTELGVEFDPFPLVE